MTRAHSLSSMALSGGDPAPGEGPVVLTGRSVLGLATAARRFRDPRLARRVGAFLEEVGLTVAIVRESDGVLLPVS